MGLGSKISIDFGAESVINDFILRSESDQNDLISKSRLHSIYDLACSESA